MKYATRALSCPGTGDAVQKLSDPEYLAAPATGDVQWVFRPNVTYAALKCDLENARRFATH